MRIERHGDRGGGTLCGDALQAIGREILGNVAASFFIRYHQTHDPWEAARFANVLASTSVTRRGLAGVPTSEEAEQAAMVWTR